MVGNYQLGIGITLLGLFFIFLGVLLFFDSKFIALGNVLFLLGIVLNVGWKRSVSIFTKKEKIGGSVMFFLGIVLVMRRWGMVGMIVEGFGFINLFGNFFPAALQFARSLPVLGDILSAPYISPAIDYIVGKSVGAPKHWA